MISIARTTNRNVIRWRDGHMVLRWTAAGMLNAERYPVHLIDCRVDVRNRAQLEGAHHGVECGLVEGQ